LRIWPPAAADFGFACRSPNRPPSDGRARYGTWKYRY
jgi:hypothetical protein